MECLKMDRLCRRVLSMTDRGAKPTIHKNMVDSVKIWGKVDTGQDEEKRGKSRSVAVALR